MQKLANVPMKRKTYGVLTNTIYQPFEDPLNYNDAVRGNYRYFGRIPGEECTRKDEDESDAQEDEE